MAKRRVSRRDFNFWLPGSLSVATFAASSVLANEPSTPTASAISPIDLVDPELRPALSAIPTFDLTGEVSQQQLAILRSLSVPRTRLTEPFVLERTIPGPRSAPEVKVFIINAQEGEQRPAIIHMHGGGYIIGKAANDVPRLQGLARALGCVIVTVEYRLAPETPFPGSLEDNYAALIWTHRNAENLGIDPTRIALAGESAGGGHAAMLAIAARDRGEVPVMFQSLVYPMLDDRTGTSRQVPPYIGTYVWKSSYNRYGWKSLLGVEPGGEGIPAGAVPARLENFAGLAPTWIGTGSLDLFVDENVEYARRLILAGVPTELMVVPGAYHGFDGLVPNSSASRRFSLSRFNALARAFGLEERTNALGKAS